MALRTPERNEEEARVKPSSVSSVPAEQLERIPTASQEEIDQKRASHTELSNTQQSDGTHLKPSDTQGIYDKEDNKLKDKERGTYGKELSPEALKDKEETVKETEEKDQSVSENEKDSLYTGEEKPSPLSKYIPGRGLVWTRRKSATVVIVGLLFGGGLGFFGFIQGPLQFIHLSQNLQNLLRNNEDFGNDRMSRVLLAALSGKGIERTRMGTVGNKVADLWEKKLVEDTGLRPLYQNPGRKHVGFEIVDEKKAAQVLEEMGLENDRNSRRASNSLNRGVDIVSPDELADGRGNAIRASGTDGKPPNPDNRVLNTLPATYKERRSWIKAISKATNTNNIVGSQGARLLIKRAGVRFHVLERFEKRSDEIRTAFINKRKSAISNGSADARAGPTPQQGQDQNGNQTNPDQGDVDASEETKDLIRKFKTGTVRGAGAAAAGPVAVAGVLCIVKDYGNELPEYKFRNIAKPMMRIGKEAVSMGDQIKSFDDFNLESMGVMVSYLHDKEKGTSWNQSQAYQAAIGKDGGIKPDPEMDLGNINEKPAIFDYVDDIPGLGTVCTVTDGIFNLPGIKQIVGAADSITSAFIDGALGVFNTSQEELLESSLKIVAGQSVDPEKTRGAAYGNAAFIGTDLAANDTAIAMGGGVMSDAEYSELAAINDEEDMLERQDSSFFARYFDPINHDSLAASLIDHTPSNTTQLASIFTNPFASFSKFAEQNLAYTTSDSHAQDRIYRDYGFKRYGFSIQERQDERFEDPYDNAEIIEPQLEELNEKYSNCFGIKVIPDENGGIRIENGESVNIFKLEENGGDGIEGCNRPDRNSPEYEIFQRYRFYIADSVALLSVNCYYDENCVGIDVAARSPSQEPTQETSTTNPNIFVLGDSLTVGMRDAGNLEDKLTSKGWVVTDIEATVSRNTATALSTDIPANEASISRSGTIVIALGTNDGGNPQFKNNASQLINRVRELSPQAKIYWMNAIGGRNQYTAVNNAINDLANSDNISVIDFADEFKKNHTKYPWGDAAQIHHTPLGYDNKAAFLVNSIGSPSIVSGGTIAASLSGSEAQSIAKEILDSGKITGDSRYMSQIQSYASGDFSCNINPTILQLMREISKKHRIYITSLNRRCTNTLTASGTASFHYRDGGGHALDIGIVDGVSSTGGTSKDIELLNNIMPLLPSGSTIGQSQCRSTRLQLPQGVGEMRDDCHHLHIQVPPGRISQ